MIGFYLHYGGKNKEGDLNMYINAINSFLKKKKCGKTYGNGLKLLLIQLFVEVEWTPVGMPEKPKLSNYSTKNKDIAVAFPIVAKEFFKLSEFDRRMFIVDITFTAIDMVEKRLAKRKLPIDFKALRKDVKSAAELYVNAK